MAAIFFIAADIFMLFSDFAGYIMSRMPMVRATACFADASLMTLPSLIFRFAAAHYFHVITLS